MTDLIDTTEMYLRTILELEEEGVVPMRARIAEHLGQSGPTVSQTVSRMARDGLVTVEGDRHLELTPEGRALATRVMRKHRLAECLLVDVIGLEWEQVHEEACRWEHVMSETVERRILELLGHPTESPYGNPIPGLQELGDPGEVGPRKTLVPLTAVVAPARAAGGADGSTTGATPGAGDGAGDRPVPAQVVVRRIGEPIQSDRALLSRLRRAGVRPGAAVTVTAGPEGVLVGSGGESTELRPEIAAHVFVAAREPAAATDPQM